VCFRSILSHSCRVLPTCLPYTTLFRSLVLVDSSWNSVEHKIEVLESNPVTATMTAVQQQRYLVLPFPASEAGVRSVPAAVDLSEQLNQLAGDDDGQSGQQ